MTVWPFEKFSNVVQCLALAPLCLWMALHGRKTRRPAVFYFIAGFFFCLFLGDLFWSLYIVLRGVAPNYFSASDVAWAGSLCFQIGTYRLLEKEKIRTPWLGWTLCFITAIDLAICIALYGHWASNLLWSAVLIPFSRDIGTNLFQTLQGENESALRPFYLWTAAFWAVELGMSLSWGIVYVTLDFMLTVTFIMMAVSLVRGVERV